VADEQNEFDVPTAASVPPRRAQGSWMDAKHCTRDCDALHRRVRVTKWARRKRRMTELGLPAYLLRRRRYWEVDHVRAVVEGGGSCGLENLRTLCWECHRKVTRELQVRRGKIRAA
jgi:5-methylcytosine-specific restriction endonuclease McrA